MKMIIEQAHKTNQLIRVYRDSLEDGWISGYVAACGEEFFVMEQVTEEVRFDGWISLRYIDVSSCDMPDPHAAFVEKALKIRGASRRACPVNDALPLSGLLQAAGQHCAALTIHAEEVDADVCYIGRCDSVTPGELVLRPTLTPDGEWDDEAEVFLLSDITRVDFGGSYEDALVIVANS